MKCRGLPPAVFQSAGAKGSAPGGSEGAVEPCQRHSVLVQQRPRGNSCRAEDNLVEDMQTVRVCMGTGFSVSSSCTDQHSAVLLTVCPRRLWKVPLVQMTCCPSP